jgi:ankyrin repeat protein
MEKHRSTGRHDNDRKDIVKLLLEKGADVNAEDMRSKTPLNYAYWNCSEDSIKVLSAHNGKTDEELEKEAEKKYGHHSCESRNPGLIKCRAKAASGIFFVKFSGFSA